MPRHIRLQSEDLGHHPMPAIVRHTDASGATVYSSYSYQPMKGHARASEYSVANNDSEEAFEPRAELHETENHEALGSEDGYQEDDDYEDRHPPGLHDMENHEAEYEARDQNAPERLGTFLSTVHRDVSDI